MLLNIMEQNAIAWTVPEEWKTGHPKLFGTLKKDTSFCGMVVLIFKAAATDEVAGISLGSALRNIKKPFLGLMDADFVTAIETGNLLSYGGEEKDLCFFVGEIVNGDGSAVGPSLPRALEDYLNFYADQQDKKKLVAKAAKAAKPMSKKQTRTKGKKKLGKCIYVMDEAEGPKDDAEDDEEDAEEEAPKQSRKIKGPFSNSDSDSESDSDSDTDSGSESGRENATSGVEGNSQVEEMQERIEKQNQEIATCKRKREEDKVAFAEKLKEKDLELEALKQGNNKKAKNENAQMEQQLAILKQKCEKLSARGAEKNQMLNRQKAQLEKLNGQLEELKKQKDKTGTTPREALKQVTNTRLPKNVAAKKSK